MVWRTPDVGLTPALRRLDRITPGAAQLATGLSRAFNGALDNVVAQLSVLPGIRIVRLDAFRLLTDIVSDPGAFDLDNVTATCVTPDVAPFTCDDPDEFLFWDGIHPTESRAPDRRPGGDVSAGAGRVGCGRASGTRPLTAVQERCRGSRPRAPFPRQRVAGSVRTQGRPRTVLRAPCSRRGSRRMGFIERPNSPVRWQA
jgi:hypothetical protein